MKYWFGLDKVAITLLRKVFFLWAKILIPKNNLESLQLDSSKPICFILPERSVANLFTLEQATLDNNLPNPMRPLPGTNLKRSYSFLGTRVTNKGKITSYPKHLVQLGSYINASEDNDVQFVPVTILWGRSPRKEESLVKIALSYNWSAPGFLRRLAIVLVNSRQIHLQFSDPVSMRQLTNGCTSNELSARKISRVLRVHFRRRQEAIVGPDLSHRRTMVNSIARAISVREAIAMTMKEKNQSEEQTVAEACRYATEIAADYSHGAIRFLEIILSWWWNKLYAGVTVSHLENLTQTAQTHEIVYVPCHRSHIDYLLMSYVVYTHGLVPPHIAAGINLNMPVIGSLLRKSGAFFMRRSFKGNPLYSAVFTEYTHLITKQGFSVEYFIEGGRSRSGRILRPRTGMLAMTTRSFIRDHQKPIAFIPVYFGYEKLLEGNSYVSEMHGKTKKKESIFDIVATVRRIKNTFGKVHVNFGEPILLESFLDQQNSNWNNPHTNSKEWLPKVVDNLAIDIVTKINQCADINPINLLSLIILSTPKHSIDESALTKQLSFYQQLLSNNTYSKWLTCTDMTPDKIIQYGFDMDVLTRIKHPLGDIIHVTPFHATRLTYLRNNCLHLFALPSLVATLFLHNRFLTKQQTTDLASMMYPFLKAELFLPWDESLLHDTISNIIDSFIEQDLLYYHRDSERIVAAAANTPFYGTMSILSNATLQTLERYYIIICLLVHLKSGTTNKKDLEEIAHLIAQRLSLTHEFNSPEFSDKSTFRNFIHDLEKSELISLDNKNLICFSEKMNAIDAEAKRILSSDIRQNIIQATQVR